MLKYFVCDFTFKCLKRADGNVFFENKLCVQSQQVLLEKREKLQKQQHCYIIYK